jgi:hypothetical protein
MPVIIATWEEKIRKTAVLGQVGKKVCETPFQLIKSWARWYICHPSYVASINRRILVQAGLGMNVRSRPCLKNNLRQKELRTWLR